MQSQHLRRPLVRRRIRDIFSAAVGVIGLGATAYATPLNPTSFASLGTLNVDIGSLTINTDTLTITGAASFSGGTISQGGGNPDVAVFTFTNFNIGSAVTVKISGTRPLALLSQGTMNISSAINVNGGNANNAMAGAAGPAGGYAGGVGGNTGSNGSGPGGGSGFGATYSSGGGGYGGVGGKGDPSNSTGGISYGNLLTALQGGSGGGGARWAGGGGTAGGGGGGAGAIELGAVGSLSLSSSVEAHGGSSGSGSTGGGGGAGGGILIHSGTIELSGVAAIGGNGVSGGGGGAGGRIAIVGGSFSSATLSPLYTFVNGGFGNHEDGKAGVLVLRPDSLTVPSGESVNVGVTTGQTGLSDPRVEMFPQRLIVQSGGTATVVSAITWANSETASLTGGVLNVLSASTFGSGAMLTYSAGTLNLGPAVTLKDDARILLTSGGNKVLQAAGLSLSDTSKIDLADNDMIIEGAISPATVRGFIQTGRNGGAWTGNFLTSSTAAADPAHTAIGYALASDIFGGGGGNFDGIAVSSSAVLVKYTYLGDANLDGVVDIKDLQSLALHYNTGGDVWSTADFNYDGVTNIADLTLLARNWQAGVGAPLSLPLEAALANVGLGNLVVPEPTLGVLGMVAMLGFRRRAR